MKRAMALGANSATSNRRSAVLAIADLPTPAPKPDTQWSRARDFSAVPEWYAVLKERLRSYARLPLNWNGEGARPLDATVVKRALELLLLLRDAEAPTPFVSALAPGGVGFEWEAGTRELTLNVLPDGSLEYARADPDGSISDGQFELALEAIRRQMAWLLGAL